MRALRFTGVTVALGVALLARPAHAAPLIATFGGPAGYGSDSLPPNDDGSSPAIDLTPAFPGGLNFFGGPYTTAYVNTNGNITFSGPVGTYTPNAFPVASQPMIAPYWGDVDIRGPGYPSSNGVFWVLQPGRMVVTWHNVGHYSYEDAEKMDFQLIISNALSCGSGDFDVEFRYNLCQWEVGSASGDTNDNGQCESSESSCVPAQVGFDAGNTTDYVSVMGSRMHGIDRVMCDTSNVGEPGVWRFGVRNGEVACPGTGEPCDTGEPGACGVGVTQCIASGVECVPVGSSSAERCDGIDNDCNDAIDDGAECEAPNVCLSGSCRPPCFEGGCPEGEVCNPDGACVEAACQDVSCPPRERCEGGACVGACDGVMCPHPQSCLGGRCVDTCDVVTCGDGSICRDGRCVPACPCTPCADDEVCDASGECIPVGCDIVICEEGFYCRAGECIDACAGASCPTGQRCERGACVDGTGPTMGADAGTPPIMRTDSGVPGGEPDASTGGEIDGGAGGGETDGGRLPVGRGAGCACRAGGRSSLPGGSWAMLVVGVAFARRRWR